MGLASLNAIFRCGRVPALILTLFCAVPEVARAESDIRPVLETMAQRGLGSALAGCASLCSCSLTAPRAVGKREGDATISIDGDLKASATSLDAQAKVTATYNRSQCMLKILTSNVTGGLTGSTFSACRLLGQATGVMSIIEKELEPGKEIKLKPEDCQLVEEQLKAIFGP